MRESTDYWKWIVEQAIAEWTEINLLNNAKLFPKWKDADYKFVLSRVLKDTSEKRASIRQNKWILNNLREACDDFFSSYKEFEKTREKTPVLMLWIWWELLNSKTLSLRNIHNIKKLSSETLEEIIITNKFHCVFEYENKHWISNLNGKKIVFYYDEDNRESVFCLYTWGKLPSEYITLKIPDELLLLNDIETLWINKQRVAYMEEVEIDLNPYIIHNDK